MLSGRDLDRCSCNRARRRTGPLPFRLESAEVNATHAHSSGVSRARFRHRWQTADTTNGSLAASLNVVLGDSGSAAAAARKNSRRSSRGSAAKILRVKLRWMAWACSSRARRTGPGAPRRRAGRWRPSWPSTPASWGCRSPSPWRRWTSSGKEGISATSIASSLVTSATHHVCLCPYIPVNE